MVSGLPQAATQTATPKFVRGGCVRSAVNLDRRNSGGSVIVVGGPEFHLAVSVDVIPNGAGPDQGPDVERERGFDQSAAAGSHGLVLPNRSDSLNHSECCARNGALGTYEGVSGKYDLPPQGWVRLGRGRLFS